MTLILTALCKNGICVCADKRSRTWANGAFDRGVDNLNKIYKFRDIPLIIFNHGVNKFGGKSWEILCSEYENNNEWRNKSLQEIADNFKVFIEGDVARQLNINIQNMPNLDSVRQTNFVLCGKDIFTGKYEFHELRWSPQFMPTSWTDTRLIGSGEGYEKYLNQYLIDHSDTNTVEIWGSIDTNRAKEELKRLFSIALANRNSSNGDEFSDNYDIECI